MQRISTPVLLTTIFALGLLWSGAEPALAAPGQQTAAPAGGDPVVLAAGDIAQCNTERDSLTAYLLDTNAGTVLTLGDSINLGATPQDFQNCFAPTWGRHFDRIHPVPGNHDYDAQGAAGYFGYFGDRATPLEPGCTRDCKGYYSFDLGAWHIVALNSEVPSHAGTEQEQWLRADLAAHPSQCTLAFWHRARISSSRNGLRGPEGLWQALYDYGGDIVLSGHDHLYERFAPLNPALEPDFEHGIRQFIVGTGGHDHFDFRNIQPTSEVRDNEAWGVMKLTLHPDSYDWEFLPISGQTFTDKGSAPCSTPKNPPVYTAASPAPATEIVPVAAAASPAASVPTGGAGYTIQAGDTLGTIGARYGLNWSVLAAANGLDAYSILEIGQVIRIPGADGAIAPLVTEGGGALPAAAPVLAETAASPPSANSANIVGEYTVRAGDTLFALAVKFGVTQAALIEANRLSNADLLQVGQVLLIPAPVGIRLLPTPAPVAATNTVTTTTMALPTPTPTPSVRTGGTGAKVHTVVSGDTIISIAATYGKDWRQLLTLNGLDEDSILQIGQKVQIE